eukprot:Em0012g352a
MDVVLALAAGRDVLAVLPTGYGKSLCYACLPVMFDRLDFVKKKQLCDPPQQKDLINYVGAQALNQWGSIALQLGLTRNEVKAMSTHFGEDSTEHLTEVFDRWKTHMTKPYTWRCLIDVLEQPAVDYRHLASTLRSKLASKLDQEPLLPELMNLVAPHVKDKWRVVGLELGIETAELNGISAPDDTKFLKCYEQIFDTWKRRAKPEYPFTWSFLISVLGSEAVQRKDIANELEKKLAKTHQTDKATVITAAMVQPPNEKTTSDATSGCATHGNGQQQPQLEYDHSGSIEDDFDEMVNVVTDILPSILIMITPHYRIKNHTKVFEFTKTVCSEWKCIGRVLGFTEDALSAIVREPGQTREEDYYAAMLRKWLDWAPPNHDTPTVQRLSVALRKVGKEMLALYLEEKYRMHTS